MNNIYFSSGKFYLKQSQFFNTIINRIQLSGLPVPELEYKFCPTRRYKFDMAYPGIKLGIEIDGSVFTMGRHTRGVGFINDCRKLNLAATLGWKVLRYADGGKNLKKGICGMEDEIANDIKAIFKQNNPRGKIL